MVVLGIVILGMVVLVTVGVPRFILYLGMAAGFEPELVRLAALPRYLNVVFRLSLVPGSLQASNLAPQMVHVLLNGQHVLPVNRQNIYLTAALNILGIFNMLS
jgi:hypothetical protein